MSRNSNPKRQRVDVDNVLPTQSASQVGSISVVDLSNRTTLTAPQGSKRSSGPTRHLTDLRTATPSITLSTFNQVIHFISFIIVKMAKRSVEVILKYRFSNRKLLDKALLPAGAPVSNKHIQGEAEGNKRLAFLGDSVLQEAVLGPWYNSKESTKEGHNRIRNLCRNTRLNQIAQRSGISNCIAKIPCQQGQVPQKTAASTVEALVGAVYLDCGKDISKVMQVLEAIGFFIER